MKKSIKYFDDLMALGPTSAHIAAALNCHQITVQRWAQIGIPNKYIRILPTFLDVSEDDLRALNRKILERRAKKQESSLTS